MKIFTLVISLFLLFSCNEKQRLKERSINVNSYSFQCISYSKGAPTIVLDVGITETYESWLPLLNKLSEKVSVFAYNRAGYRGSDVGVFPRDSKQIITELNDLLEKAKIDTPYILVGHSLGAMNMELFLATYPEKIKAAVLLDPPPLNWLLGKDFIELRRVAEEQTNQFKNSASVTDNKEEANFYLTVASEHEQMFLNDAKFIDSIKSFGSIPITVIASSIPNPAFGENAEEYQKYWISESKQVSKKSTNGKFVIAQNSRHHIHLDDENLVLREILEYVNKR